MAEIVLDRVSKSYANGSTAVKDLSLTIADGEFIIPVSYTHLTLPTILRV